MSTQKKKGKLFIKKSCLHTNKQEISLHQFAQFIIMRDKHNYINLQALALIFCIIQQNVLKVYIHFYALEINTLIDSVLHNRTTSPIADLPIVSYVVSPEHLFQTQLFGHS